jgi:hypothetical protein
MKIKSARLAGIRCFEDTGDLPLGDRFNLIVGQNNAGKSTILKAILNLQGMGLDSQDIRSKIENAWTSFLLDDIQPYDVFYSVGYQNSRMRISIKFNGNVLDYGEVYYSLLDSSQKLFHSERPNHHIVPFIAKRKAVSFNEVMNAAAHAPMTGTLHNLYSNIDVLATDGHPKHEAYKAATQEILGLKITTRPSLSGKVAGFYLDDDNFIPLDRMGDGVTEIVGLIAEICLAKNKIFVLEEPETNLHPKGLKSLLGLLRASAEHNQFIIATHSNVVVRELGSEPESCVFRVYRDGDARDAISKVEPVEPTPAAHLSLLRELGYEFTDFSLFEGWLFLEESSAEQIIRDILVPTFVPKLKGRLRTFSASGVNNLEPTVAEFRRLMTFVHLQPAYEGRLWVRADGDAAGVAVVDKMKAVFPNLDDTALRVFERTQFERYYPACFADVVDRALATPDKSARRQAKANLLKEVVDWTAQNADEAKAAWQDSAAEVIMLLKHISKKIG